DVHLVALGGGDLLRIGAADENAAIRAVVGPELGPDLKVLVRVLRDEIPALALVRDDEAVLRPPVRVADAVPVVQAPGAVDQRGPARVGLTGRHLCATENTEPDDQKTRGEDEQAVHRDCPRGPVYETRQIVPPVSSATSSEPSLVTA